MSKESLVERRGRACMVGYVVMVLSALVEADIKKEEAMLSQLRKGVVAGKEDEDLAWAVSIRTDILKDTKKVLKELQDVPICPSTALGDVMHEEDYPVGEMGTFHRTIYAHGK